MKKNKIIIIVLAFTLFFLPLIPALSLVRADSNSLSLEAVAAERFARLGPGAVDLHYEMLGEKEIAVREQAAKFGPESLIDPSIQGQVAVPGGTIDLIISDDGLGVSYEETFYIVDNGVGDHGIILVEEAAYIAYGMHGEYRFPNPETYNASSTDPWLREYDVITQVQLMYLLSEFDNNIWGTVTGVFGEPLARGEEGQKVWVLIFNIRDDAYYDPDAESYIAGYFSASEDIEYNKNMMHIDSFDWESRTGPPPAPRPYLYEGVFAHEFEHLVHFDQDPDEPSWVDEGCAELAMFLCGYGHPDRHIDEYFFWHPITALTFWGGYLEDYGQKYLWILYLYEKFGGANFISALVQEQANGIEGIEKLLKSINPYYTFDMVYNWWTIAIYMDEDELFYGKYGFKNIDIGSADTYYGTIEDYLVLYDIYWPFLGVQVYDDYFEVESDWFHGYAFGDPKPYCPHYFRFAIGKIVKAYFDGQDWSGNLPHSGNYEWYSDAEAWAWRSFYQNFDIPMGGATLNFWTFYDIEEDWDYGYVEVYNGTEWFTLEDLNGNTVITDPFGQDNPNCPAGRDPKDYEAIGRWNAFTGHSPGWIEVSMDLTPFAGQNIDLFFTLWQDGAFTLQNMYVDDISITEIGFFDDVEAGEGGWTTTGWYVFDGIFDNDFGVSFLYNKWVEIDDVFEMELLKVRSMSIRHTTETGYQWIGSSYASKDEFKVAIVSNRGKHMLSAHYVFGVKAWWMW